MTNERPALEARLEAAQAALRVHGAELTDAGDIVTDLELVALCEVEEGRVDLLDAEKARRLAGLRRP